MATNEKNGSAEAKDKALRSRRFYWAVGTIVVAATLFTLYYSIYVSSQQAYYNERAFRLLSSMADKVSLQVRIAENVLRASSSSEDAGRAGAYVRDVLHGKLEDHDFTITGWNKVEATAKPSRQGTLTLFLPDVPNSFRIQADYREAAPPKDRPSSRAYPCHLRISPVLESFLTSQSVPRLILIR